MRSFGRLLLALVVAVPVIAGAVWAALSGEDLAATWTTSTTATGEGRQGETIREGAPAAPGPKGLSAADLVPARRGLGEAVGQAGFLAAATGELAAGTQQFSDSTPELVDKTRQAAEGARALKDGMTELQNGTGELGRGATRVADGVQLAVDQIQAVPVVRDQILAAVRQINTDLADIDDPRVGEIRLQLVALESQVTNFQIPPEVLGQLGELKTGSREVADQLSAPGKPYHEGVFKAAAGARELSAGLDQAQREVGQLVDAVNQLNDGAKKIDAMAGLNQTKIQAVHRAMPAVADTAAPRQPATGTPAGSNNPQATDGTNTPGSDTTGDDTGISTAPRTHVLSPMIALLIAVIAMMGGAAIWMIARPWTWPPMKRIIASPALVTGTGVAATAVVLLFVLGGLPGWVPAISSAIIVAFTVAAASGMARTAITTFGPTMGRLVVILGMLTQVGFVGWAWKTAATEELPVAWKIFVHLMPLNYPTVALTVLGNDGSQQQLWVALAVLAGMVVLAALVGGIMSQRLPVIAEKLDKDEGYDKKPAAEPVEKEQIDQAALDAIRAGSHDTRPSPDDSQPEPHDNQANPPHTPESATTKQPAHTDTTTRPAPVHFATSAPPPAPGDGTGPAPATPQQAHPDKPLPTYQPTPVTPVAPATGEITGHTPAGGDTDDPARAGKIRNWMRRSRIIPSAPNSDNTGEQTDNNRND
ncbi:hypothetical protein JZY06_03865 [Corynebacterium sp. CCM 8862]|uniref:YhgE/Pip domain-containing protein n=1 Tax=Corynebacterium mendelii TaxID=2765362 RepID=A0A939IXK5_9CORY|nr:hypothetical protein [Corynebacterium mendelii]